MQACYLDTFTQLSGEQSSTAVFLVPLDCRSLPFEWKKGKE